METAVKRLYEGLFLVDSALAAAQWDELMGMIRKILDRAGADVVSLKKWDERKLAYEVKGKERGTYILVYFHCDPTRISGIERDVRLSEQLLRVMILRTDRMSREDMEKATPAELHPEDIHPGAIDPPEEEARPIEDPEDVLEEES